MAYWTAKIGVSCDEFELQLLIDFHREAQLIQKSFRN